MSLFHFAKHQKKSDELKGKKTVVVDKKKKNSHQRKRRNG